MRTHLALALALTAAALLSGCANYPRGMTQAQWDALPPEQRAAYRRQANYAAAQKRREAYAIRTYVEDTMRQAEALQLRPAVTDNSVPR